MSLVCCVLAVGCQQKTPENIKSPEPDRQATAADIVGQYRMDATPDEVAEAGGLDNLPVLTLTKDGKWKLVAGDEEASGDYTFDSGVLTLVSASEEQKFTVSEGGFRLSEQGTDPAGFVKLPTTQPE